MDGTDVADTRIRVIMRCRPPNAQEQAWFKSGEFKHYLREPSRTPNPETTFICDATGKETTFDRVFRDDCKQHHIFRDAALPTLENVFKGYCGAIMAYGQTGTGKTHTMQGYDRTAEGDERGIIPRCADYLFSRAAKETGYNFTITLAMVQIYLDKLQDLFAPEAPEMNITPDTERVEMPGLTEKTVTNQEQFMKLFYHGESHRITRKTLMNPTSSRGHAALIVQVRMEPKDPSMSTKTGKLVLVDLAGYERFALTGITTGIAAEEAKKINASLLALGAVVNGLADKQKHIPYRNSKLTRLLRDCLGGTSKSTIVLAIGPCDKYKQETAGTLYFGFRAMAVKVDARIKEEYDPTKYIQLLKGKLGDCGKTMQKMVKWMKDKNVWDGYVEAHGMPEIPDATADTSEDGDFLDDVGTLSKMPSRKMTEKRMMLEEEGKPIPNNMMNVNDILNEVPVDSGFGDEAVVQVVQEWNKELAEHAKAAEKELDNLRLRHLQDLEEARNAGVSDEVLERLKREHEDELQLLKEQNQTLKAEIIRQAKKAEAQALLTSAESAQIDHMSHTKADDNRVSDLFSHLKETCENKDEVLVRLFDLICLREAEVRDMEENMQAIAMAMAPAGGGGDSGALQMENERLKGELKRKDQHIEALKGLVSVQQAPAAGARQVQVTASRPVAAPASRTTAAPATRVAPSTRGGYVPSAGYTSAAPRYQ